MANGAHALPLLDAPETVTNDIEIGEAMASAMAWASYGVVHHANGKLPPDIKTAGGQRIAKLYYLLQSFDGAGFDTIAAREGKRAISQQVLVQHGIDLPEGVLDILAEEVLAAVHRVEAALAN